MNRARSLAVADQIVDEIPEVHRAKVLRVAASPLDIARRVPIPERLLELSHADRKSYGIDRFEASGLSKRGYWRESGHESWTHARSLVTPGTERIPTPWDLHVLEQILYVLSISPTAERRVVLRSA